MNSKKKIIITTGSILLMGLLYLKFQNASPTVNNSVAVEDSSDLDQQPLEEHSDIQKDISLKEAAELKKSYSEQTKESVLNSKEGVKLLFALSATENTNEELVRSLRALNLAPEVGSDKNEYTGELLMIRSQKELPGLRYFHAQYFSTEDGGYHPQHISFQIPPTEGSFQQTAELVRSQFEINSPPVYEKKGYIHWELANGKAVHVAILTEDEMKDSPWNAYDLEKDKGMIEVTVEDIP